MTPRIAILASGGGTTAEAFIRAGHAGEVEAEVGLIIASRQDAGIFDRVKNLNSELDLDIRCILINHLTHPSNQDVSRGRQTESEQDAIIEAVKDYDLIALMGYMKRIGPKLIKAFGWLPEYQSVFQAGMVNTHPGLLPDTKGFYGENIQKYVLDNGLPYGGQTLHAVSEEYDAGPVIAEHKVPVEPGDTPASLFARVQAVEKKYLPGDIDDFIKARLSYLENN